MRLPPAALLLLLCACGASELPPPGIKSVTPATVSASECAELQIELDELLIRLDYDTSSAELLTTAQVGVGDQPVPLKRVEGRRLFAALPPGLPQGRQDVRVTLSGGQEAVLKEGLEVTPPLAITGFLIEYILDQVRLEPFTVRIRALGPDAARFQGRVKLRPNHGKLEPSESQPFENGELEQVVTLDTTGGNNIFIEVEDCAGHLAHSNEFRLDVKP